jgi:phage repressor protein C with HTH and peptisase S24 domain
MLRHADIWRAIDRLAFEHGLTASGLARRAGLDPTTFNKSKRVTRDGKLRWPSTESLSKVLDATSSTMGRFVALIDDTSIVGGARRLPVLGYAQAGEPERFDGEGQPAGDGWDEVTFPDLSDPRAFALEIAGASMEPLYRDGDLIIISPTAGVRRGDRVVVKLKSGEMIAKVLKRRSASRIDLSALNPAHPNLSINAEEITWMARIVWASQ